MNRFGHFVEDKLLRRTNISLESTAVKIQQVLPSHIKKEKHLVSGLDMILIMILIIKI